ncbi:sulfotransferase family protein [Dongia deserti]|uniref:sulfotransferase family protein n=1 Tax=Dongia deserti TaxID=2268030 RepID=UPI000E652F20|nr:sulfotransferase family protein [Dongia deserti]
MTDGKVFCIGWAKTGTTTLGSCLEILGYKHQGQDLDLVYNVRDGNLDRIFSVVDQFDVFEDWPWILLYKELDQRYPNSKFILTVRDIERWWRSYENHISTRGARPRPDIVEIRKIIYGFEEDLQHRQAYVDRYLRHNDEVLRYFAGRPNDLLVMNWENGDGWPKLCRFLGKPVPNQPLPHANVGRYQPWHKRLRHLLRRTVVRNRLRPAS